MLDNDIEISFASMKSGKEYKIVFEENVAKTQLNELEKQMENWAQFTADDIIVFTLEELLKSKKENECKIIVLGST